MVENLHKKAAVIILLVVIVLSVLGTWTILETTTVKKQASIENAVTTGEVSIGVVPREPTNEEENYG